VVEDVEEEAVVLAAEREATNGERPAPTKPIADEIITARVADLGMILLMATLFAAMYCGCQEPDRINFGQRRTGRNV
jgi:hypothetical protein